MSRALARFHLEELQDEEGPQFTVEELLEWVKEEKLGARLQEGIPGIVENGGLATVTDEMLTGLGIVHGGMRRKILAAIQTKLDGCTKVRFGQVVKYEPVLKKRPDGRCPWLEVKDWEKREGWRAARPALATWRFCTTGTDGMDDHELLSDCFGQWRRAMPPKDPFAAMLQGLVEGVTAFFTSLPCCGRTHEP